MKITYCLTGKRRFRLKGSCMTIHNHPPAIIGIEGSAAAGKSTMAHTIGSELHIPVIETGLFYRQLTYLALKTAIAPDDTLRLAELAHELPTRFSTSTAGATLCDDHDVSSDLQSATVPSNVGRFAQNLDVRKIIDTQIIDRVHAHKHAIVVGRHIKKFYPEAAILHVEIEPSETNRRSSARGNLGDVADRNATDAQTAMRLGVAGEYTESIDVTNLNIREQAAALKEFITRNTPPCLG